MGWQQRFGFVLGCLFVAVGIVGLAFSPLIAVKDHSAVRGLFDAAVAIFVIAQGVASIKENSL
jgi:uncharacterized membrane protein